MKVLYDHQAFQMQNFGGVSRCFTEIVRHLPDGTDARIALLESDNAYLKNLVEVQPKGYKYDHFICKKHFFAKRHLHQWYDKLTRGHYYPNCNEYHSIKELKKGDFDVFHPTFFSDYFLPYLNGKPFVLTIHDMIPELYPQYFRRDDFQIVMKRKLAPLASAIVAVSEKTKQDVVEILGVPEEKVHVVYHGCSFPAVEKGSGACFDFPYILYVGQRYGYKNFRLFAKEISSVLKVHEDLYVVCTGTDFTQEEQMLLQELGVQHRFIHKWVKGDEELGLLYHHAVCFVYPSEYEGFGIPILEAYKAECLVLLNRASCFPEIAGDAAVYFEINSERSDLCEQLEYVLKMNSIERKQLLEKQRERLSLYSWDKSAMKMVDVYKSVI